MNTLEKKENKEKTKSKVWLWLTVVVLVLVLGGLILFGEGLFDISKKEGRPRPVPSRAPFVEQTISKEEMIAWEEKAKSEEGIDTGEWPVFRNKRYGYSFRYPKGILIEGVTGTEETHPGYAEYVSLRANFDKNKATRFFISLDAEKLDQKGDTCIPGPRLPLKQYVEKLREGNVINNEDNKDWKPDASVSEVIPLTSGKEEGYKLIFRELLWDKCTSMSWGGVGNQPYRVYRLYEDDDVRIRATNTYPRNQSENPLYQVMLDTLKIDGKKKASE